MILGKQSICYYHMGDDVFMIVYKIFIKSSFDAIDEAVLEVERFFMNECGSLNEPELIRIKLMIREMLSKSVEHGEQFDLDLKVGCIIHFDGKSLIFDFFNDMIQSDSDRAPLKVRLQAYQKIVEMGFNIQIIENQIRVIYVSHQD